MIEGGPGGDNLLIHQSMQVSRHSFSVSNLLLVPLQPPYQNWPQELPFLS